jgi:HSP20 family protein
MRELMSDKDDRKKRKSRKKSPKNSKSSDDETDDEEKQDPMEYFQKMMETLGKQMGIDFTKMMNDIMRQFNPNMKEMSPEEIQKMMKENMERFEMRPFVFGVNMTPGKDGIPKFERFGNVKPQREGDTVIKEEREPLVDIMEEDDEIVVVAEIPGCVKEKIELETTDRSLTIIACDEDDVRKYNTTVDLPSKINPDHAKARYRNGILEVKLVKVKGRRKGKKISVD